MVELIEQATIAFDQREEWGLKVIALKRKAQNDFLIHSEVKISKFSSKSVYHLAR